MNNLKLYIGGKWVDSHSRSVIYVENPATKKIINTIPESNADDVERAVQAAKKGLVIWKKYSGNQRAYLLEKLAQFFEKHESEICDTIVNEIGAPIKIVKDWHVSGTIRKTRFFAKIAREFSYEEIHKGYILRREPFGIIACITPWNFPLDQITVKILPALAAGNCVILKPSQLSPLTAYWVAKGIEDVGFPPGVFNMITGNGDEIGRILSGHPEIQAVSFTGSTRAGREVGCMALNNIKNIMLELGGKSAAIILPEANFEQAIADILTDCFMNSGQTCCAMTRMLIPVDKKEEIEKLIIDKAKKFRVGDPTDPSVDIGPVIDEYAFNKVSSYIKKGINEGARMILGDIPDKNQEGYFIKPVVFMDVQNDMTIAREEIFGPVLSVITYHTVEEAIEIANDSKYGLCGGVFGNKEKAINIAREIESGTIRINGAPFALGAPFGGYKQSGIGREVGIQSFDECLEIKAINVF